MMTVSLVFIARSFDDCGCRTWGTQVKRLVPDRAMQGGVAQSAHRPLRFLPRSWRAREDGGIVENRLQRVVALDQSIIDFSYR